MYQKLDSLFFIDGLLCVCVNCNLFFCKKELWLRSVLPEIKLQLKRINSKQTVDKTKVTRNFPIF